MVLNLSTFLEWVDFPVLISTVIGGLIVWAIAEASKRGKLRCFVTERVMRAVSPDGSGGRLEKKDLNYEHAISMYFGAQLEFYNSSDNIKIARQLRLRVSRKGFKETYRIVHIEEHLDSLNFDPKEIFSIYIKVRIPGKINISECLLELVFINEKDKRKRKVLYKPGNEYS